MVADTSVCVRISVERWFNWVHMRKGSYVISKKRSYEVRFTENMSVKGTYATCSKPASIFDEVAVFGKVFFTMPGIS